MGYFNEHSEAKSAPMGIRGTLWMLFTGFVHLGLFVGGVVALTIPAVWAHDQGLHGSVVFASSMAGVVVFALVAAPILRFLARTEGKPKDKGQF